MKIDLRGPMGNIYFLIAAVKSAMKSYGHTEDEIKDAIEFMKSGDYDHAVNCAGDWHEIIGRKNENK